MFEYKVISISFGKGCEKKLNELGSEGWELVQIIQNDFIFKKRIRPGI